MKDYVIITDSSCDIAPETLKAWGVRNVNLTFKFKDEEREYSNADYSTAQFYDLMRGGKIMQTSAANVEACVACFESVLAEGKDILYVGFSSGLSCTVTNAMIAADEIRSKYPDNQIRVIDTLCASAGEGLILYMAVRKKAEGASLEENAAYVEGFIPNLCHWFTVDDLVYLKRGGRIDPAAAFVGNILNIKPVLHVDDEGHLINMSKVRGRKNAIRALADKYAELASDPEKGMYFISNADCLKDAQALDAMIFEKFGNHAEMITDIGPVIGAHAGPGTLALFFVGKAR